MDDGHSPFDGHAGVPAAREHRGFALLIGFDDAAAAAAGTDVRQVAETLHALVGHLAPGAERELTLVTAPVGTEGGNLEVVRRRLRDGVRSAPPVATPAPAHPVPPGRRRAVVIDMSRHRVTVEGRHVALTYGEFELVRSLVAHEGVALPREELVGAVRRGATADARGIRAVDDLVRRVRQKLEPYGDMIRTVRGVGYRFDAHDDVLVQSDGPPA